jgi:hypothetical protein
LVINRAFFYVTFQINSGCGIQAALSCVDAPVGGFCLL